MKGPDVSVVIPAHNASATILGAVGSVLRSEFVEIEVIVVDDGSLDSTAEVASSTRDARVRVIRLGAPRGPAGARNVGIDAASGKWIAFLDADDEWLPGRLKSLLPVARSAWPSVVVDDVVLCKEDRNGVLVSVSRMTQARGYGALSALQWLSFEEMVRFGFDFKPLVPREVLLTLKVRQMEAAWGAEWLPFFSAFFRARVPVLLVGGAWYCYRISGQHLSRLPAECERELWVCDLLLSEWGEGDPVCRALRRRRKFFRRRAPWLYFREHRLFEGLRWLLKEPTGLTYPIERMLMSAAGRGR